LVSEHHIIEALDTVWNKDFHIKPLMSYFQLETPGTQYNKAVHGASKRVA
jgi:hypothetical protein